jgi:phospholipid/cholesterol/gamma-HCH transport system permease protein
MDAAQCDVRPSGPGGAPVIHLAGTWRLGSPWPSADAVSARLPFPPAGVAVGFDAHALAAWDSSLVAFLARLSALCAERHIDVDRGGLPGGALRLLSLASAATSVPPPRAPRGSFLARLGDRTVERLQRAAEALTFLGDGVVAIVALLRGRARFRGSELVETLRACGPDALPIVGLLSALLGMTFAYLGAMQLKTFGAQIYVADLVGIGMAREMGPLITGIIMAGRTGASFAAQLGTMETNEEIDALRTFGIRPAEFLVLPRLLALVAMIPLLCLYADLFGIMAGMAVGVVGLDVPLMQYVTETRKALGWDDVTIGVAKSVMFGFLVAWAGCFHGLSSGRSAAAVGTATTRAVVTGIVLIIVADATWAVILNEFGV